MRNLKKVLAMALALVMSLSLVTIANAADFSDDADISYKEAVDVMSAIGVINGYEDGSFQPEGVLTREEAAKLICTMMLGDGAEKLGTTSSSFTDVAATRWSSPYIEYCNSLGIISGNGDGTFDPTGELTGHAFAKMLLVALGYDSAREGYTGAGWSIEVAKDAVTAGIDVDGVALSAEVTREVAAQMSFNTLQATMVEYATAGTVVTTPDGTTVVSGGSTASKVEAGRRAVDYGGGDADYVEFCEEYFEDLKKVDAHDNLGRPAVEWDYDNDTVGTYVTEEPVAIYTASTDRSDVRSDLRNYDYMDGLTATVNDDSGAVVDSYSDVAALTADGTIVEVYATDGEIDYVIVVETDWAEVTSVNENRETFTISYNGTTEVIDDDSDFYGLYGQVEEDDILIVSYNSSNDVLDLYIPESITGEITYVKSNGKQITVDGESVKAAATASALFTGTLGEDSIVYLNAAGYAVYVDAATTSSADYVFVTDMWREAGTGMNQGTENIYAQVVHTDGVVETIEIANNNASSAYDATRLANLGFTDLANSGNSLTTGTNPTQAYPGPGNKTVSHPNLVLEYTESTEDAGVYMLTVPETGSSNAEGVTRKANDAVSSNASRISNVYMASDVTFVYVSGTGDNVRASTGEKAAISSGTSYQAVVEENGSRHLATVVFVMGGSAASDDVIYISDIQGTVRYEDADGDIRTGTRVEYYAYGESEPDTMVVVTNTLSSASPNDDIGFYTISGTDGEANELDDYLVNTYVETVATDMYNSYITVNGQEYDLIDALIVDTTDNGIESVSALENAIEDDDQNVYVSFTYDANDEVETVYVQDVRSSENGVRSVILTQGAETVIADITSEANGGTHGTISAVVAGTGAYTITVDPVDNNATVYFSATGNANDWSTTGTITAVEGSTASLFIMIRPESGADAYYDLSVTTTYVTPAP